MLDHNGSLNFPVRRRTEGAQAGDGLAFPQNLGESPRPAGSCLPISVSTEFNIVVDPAAAYLVNEIDFAIIPA